MQITKGSVGLLLSIVFLLTGTAAVAGPPEHAKGRPPEKFYWVDAIGDPGFYEWSLGYCPAGFEVMMSWEFEGFWMVHQSTPGKEHWEFYHSAIPTKIWNVDDPSMAISGVPGSGMNRHWTGVAFVSTRYINHGQPESRRIGLDDDYW